VAADKVALWPVLFSTADNLQD